MTRCLRSLGLLPLLLGLGWLPAHAWTVPRDESGVPAAECAFVGSSGVPTLCSVADPLPTSASGAAPTTSTTDPIGWGHRWNIGTVAGMTANQRLIPVILSDSQAMGFARRDGSADNGADVFQSVDKGRTWTRTYELIQAGGGTFRPANTALRLPSGNYVLGGSTVVDIAPVHLPIRLWRATTGGALIQPTMAGIPGATATQANGLGLQGSTILAHVGDAGVAFSYGCRSVDGGETYTCVSIGAPVALGAGNTVASPAAGVWIVATNAGVYRSVNDGVAWAPAFAQAAVSPNLVCLSATVCLFSTGQNTVYRSTDAGASWALSYTFPGVSPLIGGFVNFGGGVVVALPTAPANGNAYLSTDVGLSWPSAFPLNGLPCSAPCGITALNGSAIASLGAPGASVTQRVLYSATIGPGFGGVVGISGYPLEVDSQGRALVSRTGPTSTVVGTIAAVDQVVTLPVTSGMASVGVTSSGAWTGSLLYECSIDGATFISCAVQGLTGGSLSSVPSNIGAFFPTAGLQAVRVRGNPFTVGTATVTLVGSPVVRPQFWLNRLPQAVVPAENNLQNSSTVGAANTAVTITLAAALGADVRHRVFGVSAFCSAGTASLTIADGATTIFRTPAGAVGVSLFPIAWTTGLTGTTNTAMTITLSTCGVGNVGTLNVQADRS